MPLRVPHPVTGVIWTHEHGPQGGDEINLLDFKYGRIRDVVQGTDGCLYLLTDDADGKLFRIAPVTQ